MNKKTRESLYLGEAWLTIKWELEETHPGLPKRDKNFSLAVGKFAEKVKDKYSSPTELNIDVPIELLSHTPKFQFRNGSNNWPLLQFGPGIATVNFVREYDWKTFKEDVHYLIESLTYAYGENFPKAFLISLRYRNVIPFNFETNNALNFFDQQLNINLSFPIGTQKKNTSVGPRDINLSIVFDINELPGKGILRLASGQENAKGEEKPVIVLETEMIAEGSDCPNLMEKKELDKWIEQAHTTGKEWFDSITNDAKNK